ncbi:MAG: hypothetical protein PHW65_06890 [Dehalococcoidales bacterium]|nr:hypothetical protein [Dehalococcoidales bacterium]
MKNDVEELQSFSRWEDLTSQDISYGLRSKIDIIAAKKESTGTCDICENWVKCVFRSKTTDRWPISPELASKPKKLFIRPADKSLAAFKAFILDMQEHLTGNKDDKLSEEEWVENWKEFRGDEI